VEKVEEGGPLHGNNAMKHVCRYYKLSWYSPLRRVSLLVCLLEQAEQQFKKLYPGATKTSSDEPICMIMSAMKLHLKDLDIRPRHAVYVIRCSCGEPWCTGDK
jgi:hypothetical protein